MFKTIELLKTNFKKVILPIVSFVVLAAISLVACAAIMGKTVNILDGDIVTNLKTKSTVVSEVLNDAEIVIYDNDKVEPSLNSEVYDNMDIIVKRALAVAVDDGGKTSSLYTTADTVGEALLELGINYNKSDDITPALDSKITSGLKIRIKRASGINLTDGSKEVKIYYTHASTVGDFIKEQGIILGDKDTVKPDKTTEIGEGLNISITRVTTKIIEKNEVIYYQTEKRYTALLNEGTSRTIQSGKNGTKTISYEVTFVNGQETGKKRISTQVTQKSVNEIIEYGTASVAKTNTGESFKYKKMITCSATAYDLSYASCGKSPGDKNYGITASGMKAAYGVISVDPRVIPLGTRLYVESTDGSWSYGYCVAGDTGGGIRGNKIDLFFNTAQECRNFGRRTANVYILE